MSAPIAPLPDDATLQALAAEILARPEYARWRAPDPEVVTALLDRIREFFVWMQRLPDVSPALFWLVLGGLVLLAAALLAHVIVSLRSVLGETAPLSGAARAPEARRFGEEAEALAREGRYLEAARRLQLACLEVLLGRGVLELRRFEAGAALRRRIAAARLAEEDRRDLALLVQRLETAVFRDRTEDAALYGAWRGLAERLAVGGA